VIDVPSFFDGGESPWTHIRAMLYTLSGATFSTATLPQGTTFGCALFVGAAPVDLQLTEFYEGACFVGTTQLASNQSFPNRYSYVDSQIDAAKIATVAEAAQTGLPASLAVNTDVAVEAVPVICETYDHGLLASSGGAAKSAAVQVSCTCRALPNGPVGTSGPNGELVQPVILDAANYTAEIRDAGNRVVSGSKHYVIVGVYSVLN
jgi:hypothetical protein